MESNELSSWQQSILRSRCAYSSGCAAEVPEGKSYCPAHQVNQNAREAASQQERQRKLRGEHLCRDCRKPSKRLRCAGCRQKHRLAERLRRSRRGINKSTNGINNTPANRPVKLEVGRDGATRTRYVPRPGQGGPSREEIARGHLRLVADARRLDAVFEANYPAMLPDIDALPRIQRAEARGLLASSLVRSARLRLQVAEEVDPALRGTCAACGCAREPDDED